MSAVRDIRRDALFDFAVASPDGFVIGDVMAAYGYTYGQVRDAIRDLRLFLGDLDEVNLPCDPAGKGEQWVYRLVGTLDEVRGWVGNRVGDGESRIRTMHAMMASIVAGTDGRSIEGRKARIIETGLRHLVEDLDNILVP